jgi:hypothetical protein
MLDRHRRLAIAGVITATAIAVPAAALAYGSDSPSGKPPPPHGSVASASKSAPAASESAAAASKSAAVRSQPGPSAAAFVAALASRLGVATSAAQHAMQRIQALGPYGVDPASPAFAAIARDLGVSPARLAAALRAVKERLAGK